MMSPKESAKSGSPSGPQDGFSTEGGPSSASATANSSVSSPPQTSVEVDTPRHRSGDNPLQGVDAFQEKAEHPESFERSLANWEPMKISDDHLDKRRFAYAWVNRSKQANWMRKSQMGYVVVKKGELMEGETIPDSFFNDKGEMRAGPNLVYCRCPMERVLMRRKIKESEAIARVMRATSSNKEEAMNDLMKAARERGLQTGSVTNGPDPRSNITVKRSVTHLQRTA